MTVHPNRCHSTSLQMTHSSGWQQGRQVGPCVCHEVSSCIRNWRPTHPLLDRSSTELLALGSTGRRKQRTRFTGHALMEGEEWQVTCPAVPVLLYASCSCGISFHAVLSPCCPPSVCVKMCFIWLTPNILKCHMQNSCGNQYIHVCNHVVKV